MSRSLEMFCTSVFLDGGLNVPNFELRCEALYLSHLQKLINNYDAKWTYFARYCLGIQLRRFNPALGSNSVPHSSKVPKFYKVCLSAFRTLIKSKPDVSFSSMKTCNFYSCLLMEKKIKPKYKSVFLQINFRKRWKTMYLKCIDSQVRDVFWKIIHKVIYVNYFLFNKQMSQDNLCTFCHSHIETINHLCLECIHVKKYKQAKIRKRRNQKKTPTPKTKVGKNQTNNQVLIP